MAEEAGALASMDRRPDDVAGRSRRMGSMTRRPRWVSIASLVAAGLLAATLGGPVMAQDARAPASDPAAPPSQEPGEQPPATAPDDDVLYDHCGDICLC